MSTRYATGMLPLDSFIDELLKLAVSKDQLSIPQTRAGRRPMSVDTLLRKEKEGTLYKSKMADAIGIEMVNGKKRVLSEQEAKERLKSTAEVPDTILNGIRSLLGDFLPGGLADGMNEAAFPPEELASGIEVELEHTDDPDLAREIAMDHLAEHPGYYTALKEMESKLEKESAPRTTKERKVAMALKVADSWKPQWLEMAYTEGERGMQNVPVLSKKRAGDAPTVGDGMTAGQKATPRAEYRQPTDSALAPKVASLWAKLAATMGQQVKSPTDTVPDVAGPQNRMQMQADRYFFRGPASDAQPLTGTSSDAYTRT